MKFNATIDASEYALLEGIGKLISPTAWDDRPQYKFKKVGDQVVWEMTEAGNLVVDSDMTAYANGVNERNRARACETAMDILDFLRSNGFIRREDGATADKWRHPELSSCKSDPPAPNDRSKT